MKRRLAPIELLESRIAPAAIVNPTTVTYTDQDGDLVTLQISKGMLTAADFVFDSAFGESGPQKLLRLDFAGDKDKAGTDVTITVVTGGGDGVAHVGFIDATGIDLGSVSVPGDLGRIIAGDKVKSSPAIDQLTVGSVGVQPITATQETGGSLLSVISGKLNTLTVAGDVNLAVISATGKIGSAEIGGNLIGGPDAMSGSIRSDGDISQIHIAGDIVGGDGDKSGQVFSQHEITALTLDGSLKGGTLAGSVGSGQITAFDRIGQITISGDIAGGAGDQSGQIVARDGLTNLIVLGSIRGGTGPDSGVVGTNGTIKAGEIGTVSATTGIFGGDGDRSGAIVCSGGIKQLTLHGNLVGGVGDTSGAIGSTKAVGTITVEGDIVGGSGPRSGEIVSDTSIETVSVTGSIFGGSGNESGAIGSTGPVSSVSIAGDVAGYTGFDSGWIVSGKKTGSITIGGSLRAFGFGGGILESNGKISSIQIGGDIGDVEGDPGRIFAGKIGTLDVTGSIFSSSQVNAQIVAHKTIGTITVGGSVSGSSQGFGRARISAGNSIDEITIGGSIQFTNILVGPGFEGSKGSGEIPANPDAKLGTVTVGRSWFSSSAAVGTFAGSDGVFGTLDDVIAHGGNPSIVSTIEKIAIGGSASAGGGLAALGAIDAESAGTPQGGLSFGAAGIVAEYIKSLTIGKGQVDLKPGPRNDVVPLGFSGEDFYAREKPLSGGTAT